MKQNNSTLPIALTVITNMTIAIAELIGGFLSGSVALTADAFHNFLDSMSSLIVWISKIIQQREPDEKHTFGFKRAEVIASLFISLLLFIAAGLILREIIKRAIEGSPNINPHILLPVATVGLLGNITGILLLWNLSKDSLSVKGALVDLISDAISSVLVVTEGILLYMGIEDIGKLDLFVGALIVYFLISHGYEIFKESIHILMQGAPSNIDAELIKQILSGISQDISLKQPHNIRVHTLTGNELFVELHVMANPRLTVEEIDEIRCKLKNLLTKHWQKEVILTMQIEADNSPCSRKTSQKDVYDTVS